MPKRGRNPERKNRKSDSDSDEEDSRPRRKIKQKKSIKSNEFTIPSASKDVVPKTSGTIPPNRIISWKSLTCLTELTEELKTIRKNLGINVKGSIQLCPPPISDIQDANLPPLFRQTFEHLRLKIPSPIQMQAWPAALNGSNIIAISSTGSGKTLAFGLPMANHIQIRMKECKCKIFDSCAPIALVLVPTRELAIQVSSNLKPLQRFCSIRSVPVYGGQDKDSQIEKLTQKGGSQIVIATPGRLLDLVQSKNISLTNVTYLVLDEMDRMIAQGFIEQITLIAQQIRSDRQILLFSATFPGKLREIADEWVSEAVVIRCNTIELWQSKDTDKDRDNEIDSIVEVIPAAIEDIPQIVVLTSDDKAELLDDVTELGVGIDDEVVHVPVVENHNSSLTISQSIQQQVHVCAAHKKPRLLIRYITSVRDQEKVDKARHPGSMLIFCTKIKTLKFVFDFLKRQGLMQKQTMGMLHGQMPQHMRESALADFRAGKMKILCATDVAARGIHIKNLSYVINYDFPSTIEQYCHRIGRTGRTEGQTGHAYSFFPRNMAPLVGDLIKLLRNCNQHVEPNLLAMSEEYAVSSTSFELDDEGDDSEGEGET